MRRLQIYTWWWSSGVHITRFVGLVRHTPRRIVPTTPTEWKFVLFKHWSLSVCALRELSFVLDDSGELELDAFQNSISLWKTFCCKRSWPSRGELLRWGEQKKIRKRRTNPCLMPMRLKFFVAYRNFTNSCNIVKTFFCAHAWWVVLHMMDGSDVVSLRGLAFGRGHNEPHNKLRTSLGYRRWVDFKKLCWESWWKWKVRNHEIWKIANLRDLRQCWNSVPSGAWLDSFVVLCHTSFQGVWFREKF